MDASGRKCEMSPNVYAVLAEETGEAKEEALHVRVIDGGGRDAEKLCGCRARVKGSSQQVGGWTANL